MSQKLQSQYICIAVTAVRTQGTSFHNSHFIILFGLEVYYQKVSSSGTLNN